jgi:hypothetical protein
MKTEVIEIRFLPLVPTDATSNIQPAAAPVEIVDGAVRPDCLSNRLRNASWVSDDAVNEVPASAISGVLVG